jgi:hypothetical protein
MSQENERLRAEILNKWAVTCNICKEIATNKGYQEANEIANSHKGNHTDSEFIKHQLHLENRSSFKT